MLLTRWRRAGGPCGSCGADEYSHTLDCAAWWTDYRRNHFDDQRVARYRRLTCLAMAADLGAWVSGASAAAAALLVVTLTLIGLMVHERRKPIA